MGNTDTGKESISQTLDLISVTTCHVFFCCRNPDRSVLEKQPYENVLTVAYGKRLAFRFIFWASLSYYWMVYGEKKTLQKKQRELEALNRQSVEES